MPLSPRKLSASDSQILRYARERARWSDPKRGQILAAVSDHHARGLTLDEAANAHGVSRRAVAKMSGALRDGGGDALTVGTRGRKPALSDESFAALRAQFPEWPAPTVSAVREWLSEHLCKPITDTFARYWRLRAMESNGYGPRRRKIRLRKRRGSTSPLPIGDAPAD